jgi:hypothetical protein
LRYQSVTRIRRFSQNAPCCQFRRLRTASTWRANTGGAAAARSGCEGGSQPRTVPFPPPGMPPSPPSTTGHERQGEDFFGCRSVVPSPLQEFHCGVQDGTDCCNNQ